MQYARHLAVAVRGGSAHFSALNTNSNINRGEVMKWQRLVAKDRVISREL
jgi:hypothetical protein